MRRVTAKEAKALRVAASAGVWRDDGPLAVCPLGAGDAAIMAAAPDLAHTVEALEAERDALLAMPSEPIDPPR